MKSSRRKRGKKNQNGAFCVAEHLLLKNVQDVKSIETLHRQFNMGIRKLEMMPGY